MRPDAELGTPRRPQNQSWSRDQYLALAVGLLALLISPIGLYISHIFAETLPATAAAGSFSYLGLSRARSSESEGYSLEQIRAQLPRELTMLAPSVVLLASLLGVSIAIVTGGRTPIFYVVMILAAIVYLLEVVMVRERDLWTGLLLAQLLVLIASLRLPALLLTPSWIGIDVLSHAPKYAATMLETGSFYAGLGESKYLAAPVYHLIVVATSLLGDVSVRGGLYLSVGLAMLVVPFCVYAITRRLGVPARWAIFATTLFALTDYLSYWSIHLIPSSVGLIFLLCVLLLFAHHFTASNMVAVRATLPTVMLLSAVALTDQVSAFIMISFLSAALISQYGLAIYAHFSTTVNPNIDMTSYAVFFAGFVIMIWSLTPMYGETFTVVVLDLVTESVGDLSLLASSGSATAEQGGGGASWLVEFFTYLSRGSFLLLMFGAALGTFACIRGRASQPRWTLIIAATLTGFLSLAPPLIGIDTLLPGRWFSFLYALLAILFAIGLAVLSADDFTGTPTISIGPLSNYGVVAFAVLLVTMSVVFPIAGIASTVATVEAPILEDEEPRRALSGTEQNAADTLRDITDSTESSPVRSDAYFSTVLARPGEQSYYTAVIPDADEDGSEPSPSENVIYRTYQSEGAPEFAADDGELYVTQIDRSQVCQETDDIAYDNPDVRYCSAGD